MVDCDDDWYDLEHVGKKSCQHLKGWSKVLRMNMSLCVCVRVCACGCVSVWATVPLPGGAVTCRCFRWTNRDKALSIRTDQHQSRPTWHGSVCRPEAVATATGGMTGGERGWEERAGNRSRETTHLHRPPCARADMSFYWCTSEDHVFLKTHDLMHWEHQNVITFKDFPASNWANLVLVSIETYTHSNTQLTKSENTWILIYFQALNQNSVLCFGVIRCACMMYESVNIQHHPSCTNTLHRVL